MKIGIDIDNTITDTLPLLKKYCKDYNDNYLKRKEEINDYGYASFNLYNWSKEENLDFCIKYLEEACMQAKVKENAKDVIQKLKNDGHQIYIITSRAEPMFKTPYETTKEFLDKNGIIFDKLLVGKIQKESTCIENNIDVLIEDEPHHIDKISKFIPIIVFDEIYNKRCVGKNIFKVNNWNEVYDNINNLKVMK